MSIGDRKLYMAQAQARFRLRLKNLRAWKEGLKMKRCLDCGPQSTGDFYAAPRSPDGLSPYCKGCHKARALARDRKLRAMGIPTRRTEVTPDDYLNRHIARREEEALLLRNEGSSPEPERVVGFGFTEIFERKFNVEPRWRIG